ncbi:MAG: purine-nucleoside phosphorylase [Planctomycetota bacterium]
MQESPVDLERVAQVVRRRWPLRPRVGIILGTGLGAVAQAIDGEVAVAYSDIPGFPKATVEGHAGQLVCGTLAGVPTIVFKGRFHCYEGHSPVQAAFPPRLLHALGGEILISSSAVGGLRPPFVPGDVMLIDDHINLMFRNPLLLGEGENGMSPNSYRLDMSSPYDPELQETALEVARRLEVPLHRGVYVAMLGPNYETRAEYRMCRRVGGDAVGMSTAPETLAARRAGLRVLAISTITNVAAPDAPTKTTGHHVVSTAATASQKMSAIVREVVASLACDGRKTP